MTVASFLCHLSDYLVGAASVWQLEGLDDEEGKESVLEVED